MRDGERGLVLWIRLNDTAAPTFVDSVCISLSVCVYLSLAAMAVCYSGGKALADLVWLDVGRVFEQQQQAKG